MSNALVNLFISLFPSFLISLCLNSVYPPLSITPSLYWTFRALVFPFMGEIHSGEAGKERLTMYMGEPQSVAAIVFP